MTANTTNGRGVSAKGTYVGLWAAATAAYVGLVVVDARIAAVGAFALLGLAAVAYARVGGVRFDERDEAVLNAASGYAIRTFGLASAVVFPALVLASGLGYYSWTPFAAGVSATVTALFVLWVGCVAVLRGRR